MLHRRKKKKQKRKNKKKKKKKPMSRRYVFHRNLYEMSPAIK